MVTIQKWGNSTFRYLSTEPYRALKMKMPKGKFVKGALLCKNHFYKVFEHSYVAAVCENNQPVMVNPPNHF